MEVDINERLQFFAKLYNVDTNPEVGMWFLYLTVLLLSIIVFKLGFSRKLPLLKAVVVYVFLGLGCTILTFFAVFLPVTEGLMVAAAILIIYKVRLHQSKKEEQSEQQ
ncbi:YlaH-like family protein [Pseudalkalibacillus salsuginis]|uniref:YlaH-like family protein n=1 Tax=Pseudalkalibacillus salsuginis TaxID=2910972 RepID=UPI001F417662|nr:YlaH-like family protein [Pseudalkalibacillus salsuginis]MCF6410415.1 YlaH-like family protein [Pseudalkalibacillus salsuginis]